MEGSSYFYNFDSQFSTAALQLTKFSVDSTTETSHDAEEVPGEGYA